MARVDNQAPLGIKELQLLIQHPDTSGKMQQTTRRLSSLIPAGHAYTTSLNLGPYANATVLKAIRIQIISAELVEK
jgi:hypothetical protein